MPKLTVPHTHQCLCRSCSTKQDMKVTESVMVHGMPLRAIAVQQSRKDSAWMVEYEDADGERAFMSVVAWENYAKSQTAY